MPRPDTIFPYQVLADCSEPLSRDRESEAVAECKREELVRSFPRGNMRLIMLLRRFL